MGVVGQIVYQGKVHGVVEELQVGGVECFHVLQGVASQLVADQLVLAALQIHLVSGPKLDPVLHYLDE